MDELSSEALAPLHPADAAAEQPDSTPAPVETPARAVWSAEEQEVTTLAEAGAAAAAEASPLPVEGLCGDTTPAARVGQKWDEQTPATSVVQRHVLATPGSRAGTVFSWLRASLTPSWRKQVGGYRAQSSELRVICICIALFRPPGLPAGFLDAHLAQADSGPVGLGAGAGHGLACVAQGTAVGLLPFSKQRRHKELHATLSKQLGLV